MKRSRKRRRRRRLRLLFGLRKKSILRLKSSLTIVLNPSLI
jgi:hypothetical protein